MHCPYPLECPKACSKCEDKVTTLTGTCLNDPGFYVDGNDEHDCRWIRWKESRRDNYCRDEKVQKVSTLLKQYGMVKGSLFNEFFLLPALTPSSVLRPVPNLAVGAAKTILDTSSKQTKLARNTAIGLQIRKIRGNHIVPRPLIAAPSAIIVPTRVICV